MNISRIKYLIHTQLLMIKGYFKGKSSWDEEMDEPIDFVVTWVNGNDSRWRAEKDKYTVDLTKGNTDARYRDWDQFRFWFRSVEKYAPWVRYIYLITYGHVPEWLNLNHPKLKVITHREYIPHKYLPTFNSIPIELNIYHIQELSEHFVYFNDDVYLARPLLPEDFFGGGLPRYSAVGAPVRNYRYNGPFSHQLFSILGLVNGTFDICSAMQLHPECWFSRAYSVEDRRYNMNAYRDAYLPGMFFPHLGCPYRKTTMDKVWKEYFLELDETCQHRFRTSTDIMHQIFSLWEIMKGTFIPVATDYYGVFFGTLSEQYEDVRKAFISKEHRMICLNDSVDVTEENFLQIKKQLDAILQTVFPDKSAFEK